jgi:hypothetical protein
MTRVGLALGVFTHPWWGNPRRSGHALGSYRYDWV